MLKRPAQNDCRLLRIFVEAAMLSGLMLCLFSVRAAALSQFHYVRSDATGDGSGRDWTNAYPALPVTLPSIGYPNPPRYQLISGDTYYIADGNYPTYTFDTPPVNNQTITIKKATLADHGTDTGWSSTYGDGQAVFGQINFQASNYVLDGQKRNENDWFDASAYGFSVGTDTEENQINIFNYGHIPSNITVKYTYLPGWSAALPSITRNVTAVYVTDNDGGSTSTGLLFSHMYVTGSCNVWMLRCTNGAIVEYCASKGAKSNSENHGEIVNLYYSGENAIVRYNKFRDAYVDSGGTALVAIVYAGGLQFYGNEAVNFKTGDASVGYDGTPHGNGSSNNVVYNNTFAECGGNGGTRWGTGTNSRTYNNVWYNCGAFVEGDHDYNAKFPVGTAFNDTVQTEPHAQLTLTTSMFVNYSAYDFRLTGPTSPGDATIGAAFNKDPLNNIRGADKVWDRGAYEWTGSFTPRNVFHPADTNNDLRLSSDEVTSYSSAWKTNAGWPAPPSPIPVDYATNAASLWRAGGSYHQDATRTCPACFVPGP